MSKFQNVLFGNYFDAEYGHAVYLQERVYIFGVTLFITIRFVADDIICNPISIVYLISVNNSTTHCIINALHTKVRIIENDKYEQMLDGKYVPEINIIVIFT